MRNREKRLITMRELENDLRSLGIERGDILLLRAGLNAVGRIEGGANTFVDAVMNVLGPSGTLVSLAFTKASFIRRPLIEDAFTIDKKSYAGALPNTILERSEHRRSSHPMCSYIALGAQAEEIISDHDAHTGAYEPVRKIMQLNGKCALIGCVKSSPGFTTTHVAEFDLGMHKRFIFPKLISTYYRTESGDLGLFKRRDPGLCSNSFSKFYAHYVSEGLLHTGLVGNAYSILANAADTYAVDRKILKLDPRFNVCDSLDCVTCNAQRWDRLHMLPQFLVRKFTARFMKL